MNAALRAVLAATAVALSACATQVPVSNAPVYSPNAPGSAYGTQYGTVRGIEYVHAREQTSGGGAIAGAVIGAIVGRQFGNSADGRTAGTAIGAVGGALIGNEIEKNRNGTQDRYRIIVDIDRGGQLRFDVPDVGGLHPGDRVRIDNNQIYRL